MRLREGKEKRGGFSELKGPKKPPPSYEQSSGFLQLDSLAFLGSTSPPPTPHLGYFLSPSLEEHREKQLCPVTILIYLAFLPHPPNSAILTLRSQLSLPQEKVQLLQVT